MQPGRISHSQPPRKDKENLSDYTDSNWAGNSDDRKSCTGNLLTLSGNPITWKSKKEAFVALSIMEAECAALAEVSHEVIYIGKLLPHTGFEEYYVTSSSKVFCNNQSAIKLAKDHVFYEHNILTLNFISLENWLNKKEL